MNPERPEILLLSFAHRDSFDDSYASLVNRLHGVANVMHAKTEDAAMQYFEANHKPKAILVTDEGFVVVSKTFAKRIKTYAKKGGWVIFGLHFTFFTHPNLFDHFFGKTLRLPWRAGDYYRTTCEFKLASTLPDGMNWASFPTEYSMMALHVKNAAQHERIFGVVSGATSQSLDFSTASVDETQAAVVGAKYGEGFVFYAGDVSAEEGSNLVIMALCGF